MMLENRNVVISIIVPVYNVAQYLDECILSLVEQSYSNIEILLIDDGSTDGSGEICDKWKVRDSRVKVVHTKNYGVSHARNIGLGMANGHYIGFVDGDDWVEFDTYERMLKGFEEKEIDVVGAGYTCEGINGGYITLRKEHARCFSREEIIMEIFSCTKSKILFWELCDKLFKRKIIQNVRFNEDVSSSEDMLFLWQTMKNVNCFNFKPLYKYHYRMRDGSAVHSKVSPKSISSLQAVSQIWESAQNECDEIRKRIWGLYVRSLVGITWQMFIYDTMFYECEIKNNQNIIRKNIKKCIFSEQSTKKIYFGIFFLLLPFDVCKFWVNLIASKS